jgi:hypothetical protein
MLGHNDWHVVPAGPEFDATIAQNWRRQWFANGRPASDIAPDQMQKMLAYIAETRDRLHFQSFVAISRSGEVIGSCACQQWSGTMPLVVAEKTLKLGTVWGVWVHP